MGQECRTGRTKAEAKPTEIVLHGEVAQPNEQNLREQLIPCAAPMNPVMAVMVISPKKRSRAFALDAKVSKAPSLKRRRPKLRLVYRYPPSIAITYIVLVDSPNVLNVVPLAGTSRIQSA
jgi:hypothetical protein